MPMAHTSWNAWRRSRHWSSRAIAMTSASVAVTAGSVTDIGGGPSLVVDRAGSVVGSGGDELVVVAMESVAQPIAKRRALRSRDRDRPHDLADLALPAEQVAPVAHPPAHVGAVAVELERPGIDRGSHGPRDRRLRGDDVEDVHPPRGTVDDLEAAVAADRDVVGHDRVDVDAEIVERAHRTGWYRRADRVAPRPRPGVREAVATLRRSCRPHRLEA